jgi:urea transporter
VVRAAGEAEETVMETGAAEKHTGYGGVETDTESRPTIVDEIRSVIQSLRRLQGVKGGGFIDAVLRGLGQVVFQNNSLTGLLVLLAISVNSFVYAGAALFGAVVSTYTAMLLRIDNRLVRDGLFGFNGALTAIAMVAFSSKEFAHGDLPSALLTLYVGLAAGFSTILARAFAFMIRNDRVPGLNFPYCVATILLLGALHGFSGLGAGTVGHASPLSLGTHVYASDTWLYGTGTGISQIFLQDNWLTGIVLVAAIAVNSPIAAAAVVAGSAMAVAVGCLLGVSEVFIRSGLLGYNAALTALALGGFFVLLDRAGALYAALGVVLTACVSVGLATVLAPSGLPVLTLPFVIVTWLMLLGAKGFPVLRTIPPEYAISAEDTRRRLVASPHVQSQGGE